jgi:hypothetical protein
VKDLFFSSCFKCHLGELIGKLRKYYVSTEFYDDVDECLKNVQQPSALGNTTNWQWSVAAFYKHKKKIRGQLNFQQEEVHPLHTITSKDRSSK